MMMIYVDDWKDAGGLNCRLWTTGHKDVGWAVCKAVVTGPGEYLDVYGIGAPHPPLCSSPARTAALDNRACGRLLVRVQTSGGSQGIQVCLISRSRNGVSKYPELNVLNRSSLK
jgi:hypothetical protein